MRRHILGQQPAQRADLLGKPSGRKRSLSEDARRQQRRSARLRRYDEQQQQHDVGYRSLRTLARCRRHRVRPRRFQATYTRTQRLLS